MAEKDKGPMIGLSWQPKLPTLSSSTTKNIKNSVEPESSSALWKTNSQLVDVLFVPPNDPIKLNKLLKSQRKDTLGKDWFDMPASTITPELKRDLQLLKVGTVVESATDFYSGRLTKKERKVTIADELLYDQTFSAYRKRKVREIEEKNRPGGNDKWKIKGKQSWKRAKERRH